MDIKLENGLQKEPSRPCHPFGSSSHASRSLCTPSTRRIESDKKVRPRSKLTNKPVEPGQAVPLLQAFERRVLIAS